MADEQVKVKIARQNNDLKINPKYYPLIWVAFVFSALIKDFYGLYQTVAQYDNVAMAIYSAVMNAVFSGGTSAVLTFFVASILYNMGKKRMLFQIPKKDFIYTVMIFVSIGWFVSGIINAFSFLAPEIQYCTTLTAEPAIMTVSLAVMFFKVFVPNYLNPKQARRHFEFYGKIYVIFNAVVLALGAFGVWSFLMVASDPEMLAQMDVYYATASGESISLTELFEIYSFAKIGMEVSAWIAVALAVGMVIAYFVFLSKLKKEASNFTGEEFGMDGIVFTDGKNFYTVDDLKNGKMSTNGAPQNPFGENPPSGNPFDDDDNDGDDKVFEEFDI